MTRYLISFRHDAMTFPEAELAAVAEAAHAVSQEARAAGVWVSGGGLRSQDGTSLVATDGTVIHGRAPESTRQLGGFAIVDVQSRDEALGWAARIAVACRCAQEVRELVPDPDAAPTAHGTPGLRLG